MLTSPYLGEHRRDAEQWAKSLAHIQEIVNLWHSCQKKVRVKTIVIKYFCKLYKNFYKNDTSIYLDNFTLTIIHLVY